MLALRQCISGDLWIAIVLVFTYTATLFMRTSNEVVLLSVGGCSEVGARWLAGRNRE